MKPLPVDPATWSKADRERVRRLATSAVVMRSAVGAYDRGVVGGVFDRLLAGSGAEADLWTLRSGIFRSAGLLHYHYRDRIKALGWYAEVNLGEDDRARRVAGAQADLARYRRDFRALFRLWRWARARRRELAS